MDISCYRKVNESFRRRLVCRIGIDSGFFVEMNYMVNAMLYCLAHRIQFQLYSDDANFGTGVGWREYFLPFCEEVHESFHQKYNFPQTAVVAAYSQTMLLSEVCQAFRLESEENCDDHCGAFSGIERLQRTSFVCTRCST